MSDVLGDAGEAFRLWALTRTAITDLVGQRISVKLQSAEVSVRYSMSGGSGGYGEAGPLLQVDCWGKGNKAADDGSAGRLAQVVAAEVEGAGMRGTWGDVYVAGVAVEGWPYDSPDTQTERPRRILTVRMSIYPVPV